MSESQFEKMPKALKTAERERDLSRHTVEVQDKIINELRDEIERLRGLLDRSLTYVRTLQQIMVMTDQIRAARRVADLVAAIEKEVSDE